MSGSSLSPGSDQGSLAAIVARLAERGKGGAEANIQSDVRQLLLSAPLDLEPGDVAVLETQVGEGQRIDVEIGATVIEVKRDLRKGVVREKALTQLAGYVGRRELETGSRYVGILTDGAEWVCHHLVNGELVEVSSLTLEARAGADAGKLTRWLEGVLATTRNAKPTPAAIAAGLGAGSSAHELDRATLGALYAAGRDVPSVKMKRRLWAKLLTSALGTQFADDEALFIEHSLLVNSAEIIAHAVVGLAIETLSPASLLTGTKFDEVGVHGVVEMDFFDWVLEVPGGDAFIQTLARRLGRFDWSAVEHDVLKVLYESIIGTETRRRLGEYYTPDWLAEKIVGTVVAAPLEERVLDPACGSGTFLFHAVRRYIEAAEAAGMPASQILGLVTEYVQGVDLHPVAVALARVTYLLAIGRERLSGDRPEIRVPVYLGDSMQWQKSRLELLSHGFLTIETTDGRELFASELRFPEHLLGDARFFDELVQQLVTKATSRRPGAPVASVRGALDRLGIREADRPAIEGTYKTLCRLHDEGRNHIWGYYVRNLARPVWLARRENRVDVLVGNPPWLAYRHMPEDMKSAFREMSEYRGLWQGATVATHQDLSGLFVARATQLYLKRDCKFAFVMPNAVVDRLQFEGFRRGSFADSAEPTHLAFSEAWDLRRIRPHFFPRGCAVVLGRRTAHPSALPSTMEVWSGRVGSEHADWASVESHIKRISGGTVSQQAADQAQSPYAPRFGQGATIVPRVLFMVSKQKTGALGVPAGRAPVRSQRSANEKKPWKGLPALDGVVETEVLRPVLLGEHVLPFRTREPALAVIPWDGRTLLEAQGERIEKFPGLADWMRKASAAWERNRSSDRFSLSEQLDYHGKLLRQFPLQPLRVLYTASGMHLAASRTENRRAVVEHSLYWAAASSEEEALYLCAVLNAAVTTKLVRPFMSYGKDERHIDKYVWKLPIPEFDPAKASHQALVTLGRRAEESVGLLVLREVNFPIQRRQIREHLLSSGIGPAIDEAVLKLLGRRPEAS
jgi:SAM-dependent methyltransferase